MLIVGERINSSRRPVAEAICSGDAVLLQDDAKAQVKAGADHIDVNAGNFGREEVKYLRWMIEVIQEVTDAPLCIDSPAPRVIESVVPLLKTVPMTNSITLEPSRLDPVLALVAAYEAKVIALCQSGDSIAKTCEAKVWMAAQLVEAVTSKGIPLDDLYIDPVVFPASTDTESAVTMLEHLD